MATVNLYAMAPPLSGEMLAVDEKRQIVYAALMENQYAPPPAVTQPVLASFDLKTGQVSVVTKMSINAYAAVLFDEKTKVNFFFVSSFFKKIIFYITKRQSFWLELRCKDHHF